MKKQAGLWIDHRRAVVVLITDEGEEVKKINSAMEKHIRFMSGNGSEEGSSEDVRDRQFGNHLNNYYDKVIALVRDFGLDPDFWSGEAKGELEKRLEHEGLKEHILSIEAADKMTERQIMTKVRERFQV